MNEITEKIVQVLLSGGCIEERGPYSWWLCWPDEGRVLRVRSKTIDSIRTLITEIDYRNGASIHVCKPNLSLVGRRRKRMRPPTWDYSTLTCQWCLEHGIVWRTDRYNEWGDAVGWDVIHEHKTAEHGRQIRDAVTNNDRKLEERLQNATIELTSEIATTYDI